MSRLEETFIDTAFERQIVGRIRCISSLSGDGVDELRELIDATSAQLPGCVDATELHPTIILMCFVW